MRSEKKRSDFRYEFGVVGPPGTASVGFPRTASSRFCQMPRSEMLHVRGCTPVDGPIGGIRHRRRPLRDLRAGPLGWRPGGYGSGRFSSVVRRVSGVRMFLPGLGPVRPAGFARNVGRSTAMQLHSVSQVAIGVRDMEEALLSDAGGNYVQLDQRVGG